VRSIAPLLFCFLCGSLLQSGCSGLQLLDRQDASATDVDVADHADSVALQKANQSADFSHDARRAFPEQGWWCSEFEEWLAPERADKGYTIVLPGVEGTSGRNISIVRGLIDAGHPAAVEVRDWTTGHWPLWPYHLMALERNREQAREIAAQIVKYQDCYPGRPVTLIGHSGGAAIAVLALEALPPERRVMQVVLLAAAISADHDLSTALARTERGIVNFHSWGDVSYLIVGTLALGTIDRQHAISAGASGFHVPENLTDDQRRLYETRLHQVPYRLAMLRSYNTGGHFSPTNRKFVAEWVAPRLAATR
jgi:pimeloyl-ACP methyl ester carboxylesterase